MKRALPILRGWAMTIALLACADAGAAVATANVSNASTSEPKLDVPGTAWQPFSNAQGVPNSGKSIKVLYLSDDDSVYPLDMSTATVQLRATGGGPMIGCTHFPGPALPELTESNGNTCWFTRSNTAGHEDTLNVYYLGLLSGDIRVTATGITASGANTVDPYDSDCVLSPTPDCSVAGAAPVPAAGPPLSRKPARLVLVYDRSGSMNWSAKPADPACGSFSSPTPACKRWNILRQASEQMINVAKAYRLPGDELGVALFNASATDTGGIAAMTEVTLNATVSALDPAISPGNQPVGGTSIGAGVEQLKAGQLVDNANFNNMTLLFTDGEQNVAPFLVSDGSSLLINATQNQPFGTPWVTAPDEIGLCVFRLRADDPAGPAGTTTLQQIADRGCNGLMNSAATLDALPGDLIGYFLQVLNETLVGDKLEIVHAIHGEQAGPAGSVPPPPLLMPFRTSRRDLSLTLLLGWDMAFQADGRPTLKLSKDGIDFDPLQDPGFQVYDGDGHVSATLRAPFCNAGGQCVTAEGEWNLQVTRTLPRGDGQWSLFVITDNASIVSRYKVDQATAGVGEPLRLEATLTEAGAPLAGLADGSVRAFVSGPAEGLGNVLAASKAAPGDVPDGDAVSAAGLKALAMLADPAERERLLAALELGAEQGIALQETSPGVYTGEFPATLAEGIYRVGFRIDGSSPDNGTFTRHFNTDRYVAVQPDEAATAQTLTVSPAANCAPNFAGGCMQITLRPADAQGNLVGPGKATSFWSRPFDGEIVGAVTDHLDGRYSLIVGYTSSSASAPILEIGGLPLGLPASVAPGGGEPGWLNAWWFWLLLLLLLVILVIWWMRRP